MFHDKTFQISLGDWKGETGRNEFSAFQNEVIARMEEPPWNSTVAKELNLPVSKVQRVSCLLLMFHPIVLRQIRSILINNTEYRVFPRKGVGCI